MSTFDTINSAQPTWTQLAFALFKRCWEGLQARRQRARLCQALSGFSDRELWDMGITRGEIGYLAAGGTVDRDPSCLGTPTANRAEG